MPRASQTPLKGAEGDTWSQWLKNNSQTSVAPPALKPGKTQNKLTEVENRLQADVQKQVRAQLEEISKDADAAASQDRKATETRLLSLELHVVEMQHQGARFEAYFRLSSNASLHCRLTQHKSKSSRMPFTRVSMH